MQPLTRQEPKDVAAGGSNDVANQKSRAARVQRKGQRTGVKERRDVKKRGSKGVLGDVSEPPVGVKASSSLSEAADGVRGAASSASSAAVGAAAAAAERRPPPPRLRVRDSADFTHSSWPPPFLPVVAPPASSSLGKKYSCRHHK